MVSNYLVLVQAEATKDRKYDFWEDNTGEQYHYPNGYKNRIQPGKSFVYYKTRIKKAPSFLRAEYHLSYSRIEDIIVLDKDIE